MRNALAAFALVGALAVAPAALARDPDPVTPAAAETAFKAPAPQSASADELARVHVVSDEADQARTAGGAYAMPLIYVAVVLVVIFAVV